IQKGIEWKFLPSRASWMGGGVWERLVGMVKIELTKMQGKAKFNEYEWRAHFAEIEAILNDRPLTYVTTGGTEPEVVTPKSYLHGGLDEAALGSDFNVDQMLMEVKRYQEEPLRLYKERVKIKEQFWKNLKDNYLTLLRHAKGRPTNSKGHYTSKEPNIGAVVMICDNDMRLKWRMCIITELYESSDGQVRSAKVRTTLPAKNLERNRTLAIRFRKKAINHLIPLELEVEGYEEIVLNESSQSLYRDPYDTTLMPHSTQS
ncbi:unnamed protein product, partial [Meganyctiphanes norvegica]